MLPIENYMAYTGGGVTRSSGYAPTGPNSLPTIENALPLRENWKARGRQTAAALSTRIVTEPAKLCSDRRGDVGPTR